MAHSLNATGSPSAFLFQPTYAPWLNLIEPWWKTLRCLALAGRRFEDADELRYSICQGGIVTRWEVLDGNPSDRDQWLPSLEAHQQRFAKPPTQASADRGVFSADHEAEAKRRKIKREVLPKPGKKLEQRRQREQQPWLIKARRWHAGVEGRISVLKHCYSLDRCLNHGEVGFQRWVGWGVIVHNLKKISSTAAKIRIN